MTKYNQAKLLLGLAAIAATASASANLVTNGDFESGGTAVPANGQQNGYTLNDLLSGSTALDWDVYQDIPGWKTVVVNDGIEVQHGLVSPAGNNYVELDSHPTGNSAMYQSLALSAGSYSLSFDYQPRTGVLGDNTITAYWLEGAIPTDANTGSWTAIVTADGPPPSGWNTVSAGFTAAGPGYLIFAATGTGPTLGGYLDNVSVPDNGSTLALAGLGMIAVGLLRRKLA